MRKTVDVSIDFELNHSKKVVFYYLIVITIY